MSKQPASNHFLTVAALEAKLAKARQVKQGGRRELLTWRTRLV